MTVTPNRDGTYTVALTADEAAALTAEATRRGVTVSGLIQTQSAALLAPLLTVGRNTLIQAVLAKLAAKSTADLTALLGSL